MFVLVLQEAISRRLRLKGFDPRYHIQEFDLKTAERRRKVRNNVKYDVTVLQSLNPKLYNENEKIHQTNEADIMEDVKTEVPDINESLEIKVDDYGEDVDHEDSLDSMELNDESTNEIDLSCNVDKEKEEISSLTNVSSPKEICSEDFGNSKKDQNKKQSTKKESDYECFQCYSIFNKFSDLREHRLDNHFLKIIRCKACQKTFSNIWLLKYHFVDEHRNEKTKCGECNFEGTQLRVSRHVKEVHCEKKFSCPKCSVKFAYIQRLKRHIIAVHDKVRYSCDLCGKLEYSKYTLKDHIDSVHKSKKYKCKSCDFIANSKVYLYDHEKSHSLPFKCKECNFEAGFSSTFYNHMKIHKKGN